MSVFSMLNQETQSGQKRSFWRPDPRAIVCSIVFCMVGTFLIHTLTELLLALALWLLFCTAVGANPLAVLKNAFAPALILILITALNLFFNTEGTALFRWGIVSITTAGIRTFLLFSARLTLLVLWGSLLLTALSAAVCARAIQSLLSPLRTIKIPVDALTDVMVLSLRFIPVVAKEYEVLREAHEIRGKQGRRGFSYGSNHRFSHSHRRARQKSINATVIPLLRALLRHATNLSAALDSRAYEVGQKRTYVTFFSFGFLDLIMCAVCGVFVVFLIFSC